MNVHLSGNSKRFVMKRGNLFRQEKKCFLKLSTNNIFSTVSVLLYKHSFIPRQGQIQWGDWGDRPPKTYTSNSFHHDFVQFGKQYLRYQAICLPFFVTAVL